MILGGDAAIDEALRETFPASDAPAWTGAHAGAPARVEAPVLRRDLVQALRDDVHYLLDGGTVEARFMEIGLPVKRRPEDSINVEAVILGRRAASESIVVGAGIESRPDVALLFALGRALGTRALSRTVRLVAFGSTVRYADDVLRSGATIESMLGLEGLGCGGAVDVIRPGWPRSFIRRGRRACHHLAFARRGVRAIMLTDIGQPRECDFERLGIIAQSLERTVAMRANA